MCRLGRLMCRFKAADVSIGGEQKLQIVCPPRFMGFLAVIQPIDWKGAVSVIMTPGYPSRQKDHWSDKEEPPLVRLVEHLLRSSRSRGSAWGAGGVGPGP